MMVEYIKDLGIIIKGMDSDQWLIQQEVEHIKDNIKMIKKTVLVY